MKKANGGRLNVTKNGGKMALAATPTTTTTPTTTPTVSTAATLQEVINFSCHTLDKATKAKLTLENYYSNLISLNRERRERWQRLEDTLKAESMPEDQKVEKRLQHASKETEFLRLKRSRLGCEDFDPLKVIGRGAFGEVWQTPPFFRRDYSFTGWYSFVVPDSNRMSDFF